MQTNYYNWESDILENKLKNTEILKINFSKNDY